MKSCFCFCFLSFVNYQVAQFGEFQLHVHVDYLCFVLLFNLLVIGVLHSCGDYVKEACVIGLVTEVKISK